MTKPFLVINIVEGEFGIIYERSNYEGAIQCAVELAEEQCDIDPSLIEKELRNDGDFQTPFGDIWIHIAQAEDENDPD